MNKAYQKTKDFKTIHWHFPHNRIKLLNPHDRWRKVAKVLKVSKEAKQRLEWIIYHLQGHDVAQTARRFGIARKTFYKWFNEFDEDNLYSLYKLQDKSRAPKHVRQKEISVVEQRRIVKLRKENMCYGKMKLQKLYYDKYGEKISSWKIQKVIEMKKLYRNPVKTARIGRKRKKAQKKKRITELKLNKMAKYKKKAGYIICLDVIVIYSNGLKRYIFTGIDKFGKMAFARMYKTKSSRSAEDFLSRLYFLLDGNVPRVGHDNGSEFEKYFKRACHKLGIDQYYSRVRTPKDNPENERFNRTLQEEFLSFGNFHSDPIVFNKKLLEWLIKYNFERPHETLGYQTPMEFCKVLPMYSSCTSS